MATRRSWWDDGCSGETLPGSTGYPGRRPVPCRENHSSKRIWADDFPVVALAKFEALVVVHRVGVVQELLDVAAGGGRGVQNQDGAGFAAGALPGMRDVAREERAGAGAADTHIVADLEGDLAGEHPRNLVAVAVEMEEALGTDGDGFLEHHDALVGLVAEELQGGKATGRPHVEMLPAARGHDKAFCCGQVGPHVGPPSCDGMRIKHKFARAQGVSGL